MRVTTFITDTNPVPCPGRSPVLELRHRQHARVEDRIRELKATGLRNLPCHCFWANAAWLEIVLAAADLVTWARLIGFRSQPGLARAEIATFRYRVLHVAARITRGARQPGSASMPPGDGPPRSPPLGNASAPPSDSHADLSDQ